MAVAPEVKITCPYCQVNMEYKTDPDRYQCKDCDSEFWPSSSGMYGLKSLWQDEVIYKKQIKSKGPGAKSGKGRSKKKPGGRYIPGGFST